jgi:SAM-dependent methyltransferase
MTLLPPNLANTIRCSACLAGSWLEHTSDASSSFDSIECLSCRMHYLVVEGIPLLTVPIPHDPASASLEERAERDPDVQRVVHDALGNYFDLVGGLRQAIAWVNDQPLEQTFSVPGATWISLERFESLEKYKSIPTIVGDAETVLDLGCGYGCSSVPFLASRQARALIGVDENLFLLLLFQRYARERSLEGLALVCYDLDRLPLPIADDAVDAIIGISFFNHFACFKPSGFVKGFFTEAARVLRPGGRLALDMVPNRRHPFLTEINLGDAIEERAVRRAVERALRRLPLKRLPGGAIALMLWLGHSGYSLVKLQRPLRYGSFRKELSKALPEIGLAGLPADPADYRRLAGDFAHVEILDHAAVYRTGALVPPEGSAARTPYLILRGTR